MFNIKNSNTEFPLFFGEELGLTDAFNVTYPEILTADKAQRNLFWDADEYDLSKDAKEIRSADGAEFELIVRALSLQLAGDSLANGSIAMLFLPIISNPQAKSLVSYWNDTEAVHDRAYSRIVSQCFDDPNELLERVRNDEKLIRRLQPILNNFKIHSEMILRIQSGEDVPVSERNATVLRTIVSLLGLEGIMFLSSFATTFAVCEAYKKYSIIAKLTGLIHDDESVSHVRNNLTFLNILINKEKYPEWETVKHEAKEILDTIIDLDKEWVENHLFEGIGEIVGYNAKLARQYTLYLAKPLYDAIGLQWDYDVIEENPFTWIKYYTKQDLLQTAQQETESGNYMINASLDDTEGVEFEF